MGFQRFFFVLFLFSACLALRDYNESLVLQPLPRNKLLASFEFHLRSLPESLTFYDDLGDDESIDRFRGNNYQYFSRNLGQIIERSNVRELHLRFTQGWWDAEEWGKLPANGKRSGGTGVEIWSVIEAPNLSSAKESWFRLSKQLSGFFCASLNFVDDSITTFPGSNAVPTGDNYIFNGNNSLYVLRVALPSEPICTENLTPFLKLLPTRGKTGVSSLLEGHKVYDSLWHSMSIDINTTCDSENGKCHFDMQQSLDSAIDLMRSKRRLVEGIPKPTPGDELRCDESKPHDIWKCFPLGDPISLTWNLETIFGRKLKNPAFDIDDKTSMVVLRKCPGCSYELMHSGGSHKPGLIEDESSLRYFIGRAEEIDFQFETQNSTLISATSKPPLHISRSLSGYSLDHGGMRTVFHNPNADSAITFNYFETLPWYMRLFLNTLRVELKNGEVVSYAKERSYIKKRLYRPSIDRARPSHLEFEIELPPLETISLSYEYDKSLLLYSEYPPDANHGYEIAPAVVIVFADGLPIYEMRSTSSLLSLPTPDFSMPYNVIILTCTTMSLIFGSLFNLLTKKVVTEEEFEKLSSQSKLKKFIKALKKK